MHLEQIQLNFDKRRDTNGLQVVLKPGATDDAINATENRIGHEFPDQVRAFYKRYNGLTVDDPEFVILSVNELIADSQSRIHFATANGNCQICFDCSHLNEAEQWDIIELETGGRITFTMASFWTNKIWKWIDQRLAFWRGEA